MDWCGVGRNDLCEPFVPELRPVALEVERERAIAVGSVVIDMSAMDPLAEDQPFVELEAATEIHDVHCVRCVRHLRMASHLAADQLWRAGGGGKRPRILVEGTLRTLSAVIQVIHDEKSARCGIRL